jgi:hypothetical protein
MQIPIEYNDGLRTANIIFGGEGDLTFISDWRRTLGADQHPFRRDAVDFAELATQRFKAYAQHVPYANSIEEIGHYIQDNPHSEVGCCALLKCDWFPDSAVIGIAHFRRSWCNRIILDYLAAHPYIVHPPNGYPHKVRGAGTGLLYFLCTVARDYNCGAIWGEATSHSYKYYKKHFDLDSVQDLIYAEPKNFMAFIGRIESIPKVKVGSEDITRDVYETEVQNPPFVGSKTALFNPAKRLAYRFLDLPHHVQHRIVQTLGVVTAQEATRSPDEFFKLCFKRAKELGKLGELWKLVEEQHPDGDPTKNPF